MTFESFPYARPDMAVLTQDFEQLLTTFQNAPSAADQGQSLTLLNDVREEFSTMFNLCHIRHTANMADKFYEEENDYFDQQAPAFEALNTQ